MGKKLIVCGDFRRFILAPCCGMTFSLMSI